MTFFRFLRSPLPAAALALALGAAPPLRADETETLTDSTFRQIAADQTALLAEAAKEGDKLDTEAFRAQVDDLCHRYEMLLEANPRYAMGYAGYGYLLWKVGMRKEAVALLLRANAIDPHIALVKNEIGNYLAEEGRPLEAVSYYLAAIEIEPNEPLYHYQLGELLYEGRDEFLRSGDWTRDSLQQAMHDAFGRAAALAPDRIEFTYRYAESFYDLDHPDWNAALKAWADLEAKAPTAIEREVMRLHAANILIKQDKLDAARVLLDSVTVPELQLQKQKLVAMLPENAKK